MVNKIEKVILGVWVALVLGVGSLLVTAVATNNSSLDTTQTYAAGKIMSIEIDQDAQELEDDTAEGDDVAITGNALLEASSAALKLVGEGRVTETEIGDEEGYYEIEITLDNGRQVDVHLDENFNFLSRESDDLDDE